jgi:8-oxo-dGTP pyrophosphatase MutT (NUDIX family)
MTSPESLIPAATVLLVRDAPDLEVLMVERHYQIDFAAGALVFPGGKIAAEDSDPAWAGHLHGATGLDPKEQAMRIAAIREAFEESGLLLARPSSASPSEGLVLPDGFGACLAARAAIAAGKGSFLAAVQKDGLALALDLLVPFAHWITPKGMPKRFDTRFYVALAPHDQDAAHDGHEAVDAVWIAPAAAVKAAHSGERKVIFPTRLNLQMLAEASSAADAMKRAAARQIVVVEPNVGPNAEGVLTLTIPPDAGYGAVSAPLSDVT